MELKLGLSKALMLYCLIWMVDSIPPDYRIQQCNKIMNSLLPQRCAYEGGSIYDGERFCDIELNGLQVRGPARQCCYTTSRGVIQYNPAYWFQIYDRTANGYEPQNILRYLDETLAQEGRSFCIVGEHFYQTQLIHWKNFKMFMPLAGRFFDIGNHIDPLDSRLMNTFIPFDIDTLFRRRSKGFRNVLKTAAMKADFREVYCGTRTHPSPKVLDRRYRWVWRYCGNSNPEYPYDTLDDKNDERFKKRPPMISEGMTDGCKNPYKVKVTRIEVDELQMKNYLHIKVYSDDVSTPPAGGNCPTGKMKYIMLEVRDQDGFPVGQFTNEIPCDTDHNKEPLSCPPSTRPCAPVYGSKKNFMPCMFSHHLATEAPMIFLAGVETSSTPAGNATGGGAGPGVPGGGEGGSYFTEVHATWRFAQMSSHFITELHFATMIIEDEKPIRYYSSRMTEWEGVRECSHWPRRTSYYGYKIGANCCLHRCGGCWVYEIPVGFLSTEYGTFDTTEYCNSGTTSYLTANLYYHCGLSQFCSLNYHVNGTNNTDRPYGFSAQYHAIKLKKDSLGGWDYFRKGFIRDSDVNCHKDIPEIDPYFELVSSYHHGNQYARLPVRRKMFLNERYRDIDGPLKGELTDYMTPGRNAHDGKYDCRKSGKYIKNWVYLTREPHLGVQRALKDVWNDPVVVQTYYAVDPRITEYFGTKYTKQGDPAPGPIPQQWRDLTLSLTDMVEQDKTRCPCPFVPTTEAPEIMTKAPVEVHARHLHVINMLIAWVVLVPLGYFVARYYKETFSKVFFLQEFWWYTIHVLALLTALLFMVGSFYAMHLRRKDTGYKILWTDATTIHIYFGYSLVGVYVIHVLLGAFRAWDLYLREMQIWLHWGVGWAEYFLAAATIISAAAIPQGLFNCESFYIYVAFLVVQFFFFALMENHMRKVDNDQLHLTPPRPYFPVPMMRIFHKDAPGSFFRIVVLIAFFLVSIGFYAALHISTIQQPVSCFQKKR
ncbi:unnamed protein product [Orchesella dallaii]|uniref:ascorbate ferrireductase (transmembrane) n=1 Tax=Orchesella dallaii TaxID=48710 RepID=A0ABP1S0J9_9HEXA